MEHVEVAIIGAGLDALRCGHTLAKAGLDTLVVERGDYPGSKNVTGGRLYMNPVRRYLPDVLDSAPFERYVTKERLSMLTDDSSVTLEFRSDNYGKQPHHSYTILRPTFDRWLAEKATEAGAAVVSKYKVDGLLQQNGRVVGIKSDGEEIGANAIVAADGAMSFIAQEAGLRSKHDPHRFAVGVKETIEMSRKTIEDRFNLHGDEGCAQLYFGSLTKGLTGGGFLYTNRETLSLGIVVGIGSLMASGQDVETFQLMEDFKQRPEVSALVDGGQTVEYSAHTIPEGGIGSVSRLFGDGIIVVGDAAGFALNMGIIVRGMDLAIASGVMAAETIKDAKTRGNYSSESLAGYERMLNGSFVMKDMRTFRNVWRVLNNPRLFLQYPAVLSALLEDLMFIGSEAKPKLSSTVLKHIGKRLLSLSAVKDALGLLRV